MMFSGNIVIKSKKIVSLSGCTGSKLPMAKFLIQCMGPLKDFFPDDIVIENLNGNSKTIASLTAALVKENPAAEKLLQRSKFADDENILTDEMLVSKTEELIRLYCLPPASGG